VTVAPRHIAGRAHRLKNERADVPAIDRRPPLPGSTTLEVPRSVRSGGASRPEYLRDNPTLYFVARLRGALLPTASTSAGRQWDIDEIADPPSRDRASCW